MDLDDGGLKAHGLSQKSLARYLEFERRNTAGRTRWSSRRQCDRWGAGSKCNLIGTVIDATRVVDESGAVLWEGGPLGASRARAGTILGASRIVDDPEERARLHAQTGAEAVDMESGPLARSGRLVGCLRAVSDTPARRLGGLAQGATPGGEVDPLGFLRGFVREPVVTLRAVFGARRALKSLEALG